jgi:hypothetical protein
MDTAIHTAREAISMITARPDLIRGSMHLMTIFETQSTVGMMKPGARASMAMSEIGIGSETEIVLELRRVVIAMRMTVDMIGIVTGTMIVVMIAEMTAEMIAGTTVETAAEMIDEMVVVMIAGMTAGTTAVMTVVMIVAMTVAMTVEMSAEMIDGATMRRDRMMNAKPRPFVDWMSCDALVTTKNNEQKTTML